MIKPGETLQNRYRIERQIGQGGMGAVYVAVDERFDTTVAIKETLCMDDNFRKAIEREARLLSSLKHPSLPRVSDHFEENDSQFLVMEFIEGDDVASILEREGRPFPVEKVLAWADDLLNALDYLHNQSLPVIHRDIKPQNLKITPDGRIMLLDFGLAKGSPTDASHKTAAKSIFGYSRNYASLEQIQGTGTDPRSDLYSLAATLYHLVTGVPPEDALTRAMSVLSNRPDPLIPASVLHENVPAGLAGILRSVMDLSAENRPASAAIMRSMLANSADYEYLADTAPVGSSGADAKVFAQPTQLMPIGTRAGTQPFASLHSGDPRSDINTGQITQAPTSRGGAMAAGAGIVVLAFGILAGGVYMLRPEVLGVGNVSNTSEPAQRVSTSSAETRATNAASDLLSNSSTGNIEAAAPVEKDVPQPRAAEKETASRSVKQKELPSNAEVPPKTAAGAPSEPDLPPGGMIITRREADGKITTMKVNPGERPQRPPMPPASDWLPRDLDMTKLTPEQQRRINDLMRRSRPRPSPAPETSPGTEFQIELSVEPEQMLKHQQSPQ